MSETNFSVKPWENSDAPLHLFSPSTGMARRRVFAGGICWDHTLIIKHLWPGKKHTIEHRFNSPGGGAAHNALLHRQLNPDAEVILLAPLGDDRAGQELREYMEAHGVQMPWPAIPRVSTSVSFAITEQTTGTTTILCETGARAEPLPLELLEDLLPQADVCCLIAPWVSEQIAPIAQACAARRVPLVFGLGRRQIDDFGYARLRDALAAEVQLVICNRHEAEKLTGEADVAAQLEALRFGGRAAWVVITDGANGLFASHGETVLHVPAYNDPARPIVDDLGAGDACLAGIVHAWLDGYPLKEALKGGVRLGFEACTGHGTAGVRLGGAALRDYLSLSWRASA